MAEHSWWENLLTRMFMVNVQLELGRQSIRDDIFSLNEPTPGSARATPSPSPSGAKPAAGPTMAPNAPAPVAGQTEREQVIAGLTTTVNGVKIAAATNPLYGSVPDAKVYMGNDPKKWTTGSGRVSGPDGMNIAAGDKTSSIQDVLTDLNTWSEKKRKKFADLAVNAGLMKTPSIQFDDLESILGPLAIRAAKLYENGVKITPWSLLERYGATAGIDAAAAAGPITTTSTSRNVNLSSARDANSLVDAALASRLGRAATDEEKKKFLASLNAAEKKEPTVTSTTTTTTGSGTEKVSSNSSSKTSGGVNAQSFASEWSLGHNKDEAGSYQALSQYMPLFFQAIESPI